MPAESRPHADQERGFTLIELLVVILIIGILAAIAMPLFLNQPAKAKDSSAKELARTAQTVAETIATGNEGSYNSAGDRVSPANLNAIEPTIPLANTANNAFVSAAAPDATGRGYTVTTKAADGSTFTVTRSDNGMISHSCTAPAAPSNGGCVQGTW